jgi:ABC-type phosphate transport system substrate-binding protein
MKLRRTGIAGPCPVTRRAFGALAAATVFDSLLWSQGATAATAGLAVIVHPSNTAALSADDIADIFRTVMRTWPGGRPIAAFELPPSTDERIFFDRAVLKLDPDDIAHFWIDRRIRGGAPPPHQVPDPVTLARVVARLETAIGYVPIQLADSSVRTVAQVHSNGVVTGAAGAQGMQGRSA